MGRMILQVDVDGTIADTRELERLMLGGAISPGEYLRRAATEAEPIAPVVEWLQHAAGLSIPIHYVTGRASHRHLRRLLHRLNVPPGIVWAAGPRVGALQHKVTTARALSHDGRSVHALDDNPDHLWALLQLPHLTGTRVPGWPLAERHQPITVSLPPLEKP